jgi:Flp pilus assembly protein TadG
MNVHRDLCRGQRSASDEHDRGQATLELALALPILMLFLLAGVQLAIIVRAQLAVVHAAREGARAAAVSSDPVGAAQAAARSEVSGALDIGTATSGDRVLVTVGTTVRTDVPIVGALIGDVTVIGSASMRFEP